MAYLEPACSLTLIGPFRGRSQPDSTFLTRIWFGRNTRLPAMFRPSAGRRENIMTAHSECQWHADQAIFTALVFACVHDCQCTSFVLLGLIHCLWQHTSQGSSLHGLSQGVFVMCKAHFGLHLAEQGAHAGRLNNIAGHPLLV